MKYISSNKNHHQFLQFNEVLNGISILFLVIFGTYQIICELFLLCSTFESLVVSCLILGIESRCLNIFCASFVMERPCDKQNITFMVI